MIYQNTEDDVEDTVLPRFLQAGGDPKRLCFIREDRKALIFSDDRLFPAIGSIDIVGAARSALLIARTDKDKPDERVMAVQKCNLAPPGPAVVFSVGEKIEWIGQTDQTADDILSGIPAPSGRPAAKAQEAEVLLQTLLAEGPRPAAEVYTVLEEQGISKRTTIHFIRDVVLEKIVYEAVSWAGALSAVSDVSFQPAQHGRGSVTGLKRDCNHFVG